MTTPAQLIAKNLSALPHPDGTPRQLAGFSTQLLPEALQQQMSQTGQDIGEAIINLLSLNGYRVVTEQELNQPATETGPPATANVHCTMCDKKLFSINLTNPAHVLTNGRMFVEGIGGLNPECPHQ